MEVAQAFHHFYSNNWAQTHALTSDDAHRSQQEKKRRKSRVSVTGIYNTARLEETVRAREEKERAQKAAKERERLEKQRQASKRQQEQEQAAQEKALRQQARQEKRRHPAEAKEAKRRRCKEDAAEKEKRRREQPFACMVEGCKSVLTTQQRLHKHMAKVHNVAGACEAQAPTPPHTVTLQTNN